MPPVTVFWYDGVSAPPYWPQGIPQSEPLIGGPGSFGLGGSIFYGKKRFTPQQNTAGGAVFVGDKGFLTSDGYGDNIRLLPESRHKEYKLPPQLLSRSPGHYRDFVRACKGGDPGCSNFAIAAPFVEWVLLGSLALHFDGKLEWDSGKMKVTNNSEANVYVKPKYRKGWEIGQT
jgi:hypothetical protein